MEDESNKTILEFSIEHAARKSAEMAVRQTLISIGLNPDNPSEMQADMVFIRNLREGSESMRRLFHGALLSTIVGSTLWLLWNAFKQAILH